METRGVSTQKQIAPLLIQADKLVKEGNLSAAMEIINKARIQDPQHLYAIAYEERIKALIHAEEKKKSIKNPVSSHVPPQPELYLSRLSGAMVEKDSPSKAFHKEEAHMGSDLATDSKNGIGKKNLIADEEHKKLVQHKTQAYLLRAENYFHKSEYNKALDEIARAYMLDPFNKEARTLEEKVRRSIAWQFAETIAIKSKAVIDKEKRETELREMAEDRHRAAIAKKLNFMISRVSTFINKKEYNRALEEISRAYILDPENPLLPALEEEIHNSRHLHTDAGMEKETRTSPHTDAKRSVDRVTRLLSNCRLEEALGEIAAALIEDPFNQKLLNLERVIVEAQHRQLRERQKQCNEIASSLISQT